MIGGHSAVGRVEEDYRLFFRLRSDHLQVIGLINLKDFSAASRRWVSAAEPSWSARAESAVVNFLTAGEFRQAMPPTFGFYHQIFLVYLWRSAKIIDQIRWKQRKQKDLAHGY